MICATLPRIRMIRRIVAGLETCSGARSLKPETAAAGKLEEIKKEPNRKAVAAPNGGPRGVLLPFLTEDLRFLYHNPRHPGKSPPF
jgi:hypothetical protein